MNLRNMKKNIWINVEESDNKEYDYFDNNVDVAVTFSNRSRWLATFVTYKNIETLRQKNEKTGECMYGAYFWASDMILIDNVSRERIEEVIDYLIEHDEFKSSFTRSEDVLVEYDYLYEANFFDK